MALGAVLRQISSDKETNLIVAEDITTSNVEEHNVSGVNGVAPPSPYPSTAVHGASSSKKISAIRGWTKDDMMKAIDDVKFNGYSIRAVAKKYKIAPTSMHYWLNGLTNTKRKGLLQCYLNKRRQK